MHHTLFSNIIRFPDKETKDDFDQWVAASTLVQIRCVSVLTGLLYLVYAYIDTLYAPEDHLYERVTIHLALALLLFAIAALTLNKRLYKFLSYILMIAPVFAALGNIFITSGMPNPSLYLTELYLILYWVFTVSGLRLRQATISAVTIFIIVLISTIFFLTLSPEAFTLHLFWMLCSLSFGFLIAFLLEKSNRKIYLGYKEMEQLAVTDKLTGLFNRAKLDPLMKERFEHYHKELDPFGVAIIDIDNFKSINDRYGHITGDAILIKIGQVITEHLPHNAHLIRWGGEEFMIIAPNSDHNSLALLTERLRQIIQQYDDFGIDTPVTVSIGFTICNKEDNTDRILKRADDALYTAKKSGKNRTHSPEETSAR